jgi:hypothetical protein
MPLTPSITFRVLRNSLVALAVLYGAAPQLPPFTDMTRDSGIAFVLKNGATPERHQIETMAGGVAAADFDGNGLPDIFLSNGARQPELTKPDGSWHNGLYLNRGKWKFEDVTARAGVSGTGFAFGAAAADYDNDGDIDLFVAGMPWSHLYRNRGDATFEDVTVGAGLSNRQQWPIGAAWLDYDNDGTLDLFVVNYVRWNPAEERFCGRPEQKLRTYCDPRYYQGLPNTLFHNNGDGTFSDVSESSGIRNHIGKGMGVAVGDYDKNGLPDIVIANDTVPNMLFRNEGSGRFTEVALEAGVAFSDDGRALSSMGVDLRDLTNDGSEDLFVTALSNETFPLFRSVGRGLFLDVTYPSKIGAATLPFSGWSAGAFDFNNDGWKDLFAANGGINDNDFTSDRKPQQPNALLLNRRDGTFTLSLAGKPALHRGAAFADFDGDGGIDVVVTALHSPPVLLRNTFERGHWVSFRLKGSKSNRQGLGARIHITSAGLKQSNHATTAVGYASSSDASVHFGLGEAALIDRLEIRWPDGTLQVLENIAADKRHEITEP